MTILSRPLGGVLLSLVVTSADADIKSRVHRPDSSRTPATLQIELKNRVLPYLQTAFPHYAEMFS